jgi:predicted GIY-YIG superfamily endonuclease
MAFWTYMLHCRGGHFYVGHTDELERRIGEHKSGLIPGFTADHQPVELVWSVEFPTRDQAKDAERKLKGWSRAKKLALIRGDWERVSALAKKKNSASTSSAWTGMGETVAAKTVRPELVEGPLFSLQPHPQYAPSRVKAVAVRIYMTDENDALLEYLVTVSDGLIIPKPVTPRRSDGLWQTTCFELFLRSPGCDAYWEFNLSPSNEWAAYRFERYREGMSNHPVEVEPQIETQRRELGFELEADVDFGGLPKGTLQLGLSAVIEEADGTKSYWALAHPPGKPDFHHPACFAATLPPPITP